MGRVEETVAAVQRAAEVVRGLSQQREALHDYAAFLLEEADGDPDYEMLLDDADEALDCSGRKGKYQEYALARALATANTH